MIKFFKTLFSPRAKLDIDGLLRQGAIIVDVRTDAEFRVDHAKGSINIPLDKLNRNLSRLKTDTAIITCCASGMRSATAKKILITHGFTQVYNAGSWKNLKKK
jgi:phage shock protein E